MTARRTLSPAKVDNIGRAAAKLHRLLKELGHSQGLQQSAATMPDARDRLSFIDQTMHEASEKTISAVENSLPLTESTRSTCASLAARLSGSPDLAHHSEVQEAVSHLGEIAAAEELDIGGDPAPVRIGHQRQSRVLGRLGQFPQPGAPAL